MLSKTKFAIIMILRDMSLGSWVRQILLHLFAKSSLMQNLNKPDYSDSLIDGLYFVNFQLIYQNDVI